MRFLKRLLILGIALIAPACALADVARFSPFDMVNRSDGNLGYVNEAAPRGGVLHLGSTVNFDTTNLMRFPGRAPSAMSHIFDTLLVRRKNEIGVYYGLLAKGLKVAPDFSQARFELDPEARWHDGTPVTANDVVFTFETLREHGLPRYRSALQDIMINVIDAHTIVFVSSEPGNWRYNDLVGTFPIQSRAFWEARDASQASLEMPLGSGPYSLKELTFNKRVVLERAPEYSAKDHPLNRGRWNFDRVELDIYFDENALIEAVKRGDVDFKREWAAPAWLNRYKGRSLSEGRITRTALPRSDGGALNTLVFNQRRPPLNDVRVREALSLAFDAGWYQDLQGGVFDAPESYYGDTEFSARGALGEAEMAILSELSSVAGSLSIDDLTRPNEPSTSERERFRRASALLEAAGFEVRDGLRVNTDTGEPLEFTYVTAHRQTVEYLEPYRQALGRLGIALNLAHFDYVAGRRLILDHEYDLTWLTWQPRFPPGSQESFYWHSDQAGDQGYGLAGLDNPAADLLIARMQSTLDLDEVKAATRIFDRLLRAGHYTIPMWHQKDAWFVHSADLTFPTNGHFEMDPVQHWWWDRP